MALATLALLAVLLLAAGIRASSVPYAEQLRLMARMRDDGHRALNEAASVTFATQDKKGIKEYTHTLELVAVGLGQAGDPERPGWCVTNTMIGKDETKLFNVKAPESGINQAHLSPDPRNKYMLPFKPWLEAGVDISYACGVGDNPSASWTKVGDGCNAASTETYGSEDECGCALRYTSTKASRRWIVHASGAIKLLGMNMLQMERDGLLSDAQTAFILPSAEHRRLRTQVDAVMNALGNNFPAVATVSATLDEKMRSEQTCRRSLPASPVTPVPTAVDVEAMSDADVQALHAAICARDPTLCSSSSSSEEESESESSEEESQSPSPSVRFYTQAVRTYTVESTPVDVKEGIGDGAATMRTLSTDETFLLAPGTQDLHGRHPSKIRDGKLFWLAVDGGGYVQ
jgi:hypothetical protein